MACLVAQNQLGFLADPQGAQGEDPGLGLIEKVSESWACVVLDKLPPPKTRPIDGP